MDSSDVSKRKKIKSYARREEVHERIAAKVLAEMVEEVVMEVEPHGMDDGDGTTVEPRLPRIRTTKFRVGT